MIEKCKKKKEIREERDDEYWQYDKWNNKREERWEIKRGMENICKVCIIAKYAITRDRLQNEKATGYGRQRYSSSQFNEWNVHEILPTGHE